MLLEYIWNSIFSTRTKSSVILLLIKPELPFIWFLRREFWPVSRCWNNSLTSKQNCSISLLIFQIYLFMDQINKYLWKIYIFYILPLRALKTHAMAKKPIPTDANPQPATSSYLNAPMAISAHPTNIIIKVAHAKTVFLFIIFYYLKRKFVKKVSNVNMYSIS